MHGRTGGDEETLVEYSNYRKLALHIGCAPNAKEYCCCCLPVISLLCTALEHAHARIQSLKLRESQHTSVNPGWTRFNPHQDVGWLQPGFDSDSSKVSSVRTRATRVQPEFNPGSSCSADVPLVMNANKNAFDKMLFWEKYFLNIFSVGMSVYFHELLVLQTHEQQQVEVTLGCCC